jgi:3',5'-cyclic AMP phosphodiesterase CpdA
MQAFNLQRLSEEDRGRVAHYLSRRSRLHNPGVYRLFWPSVVDARSSRVDPSTWDYIGYDREAQGQWTKDFFFAFLADPLLGYAAAHSGSNASAAAVSAPSSASVSSTTDKSTCVASGCEAEVDSLRAAISAINRLRPRFVVMAGNFTYRSCDQVTEESSSSLYESQLDQFRKTMARVSETIPVLYVPGPRNVGEAPTPGSLAAYSKRFGNHFYGFWYGGLRCLVINSPLLANPTRAPAEAAAQEKWLAEEIELGKFNSTHLAVFSHHPWFVESPVEGELLQDEEAQRSGESPAAPSSGFSIR